MSTGDAIGERAAAAQRAGDMEKAQKLDREAREVRAIEINRARIRGLGRAIGGGKGAPGIAHGSYVQWSDIPSYLIGNELPSPGRVLFEEICGRVLTSCGTPVKYRSLFVGPKAWDALQPILRDYYYDHTGGKGVTRDPNLTLTHFNFGDGALEIVKRDDLADYECRLDGTVATQPILDRITIALPPGANT